VYGYVRRRGYRPEDAKDHTQEFFAKLLEKNFWARADLTKGKFRSFLLTALNDFLTDQQRKAGAAKQGGKFSFISIDEHAGEAHFLPHADQDLSPEQQFDKQWALKVFEQAWATLRKESIAQGKLELLNRVNLFGSEREKYAEIAKELQISVAAIKTSINRWWTRLGELMRDQVKQTVSSPADLDAEMRYLISILRQKDSL